MSAYLAFAQLLDYPKGSIGDPFDQRIVELASECPEAAELLAKFRDGIAEKSQGAIEELYTNAFDLRPDCTPNLGYHIFGDDSRRGVFLAELKERMERSGIEVGVELPDHVSLILRYMDAAEDERLVLIQDCLLPSLTRMVEVIEGAGSPYQYVLRSLIVWLRLNDELNTEPANPMNA